MKNKWTHILKIVTADLLVSAVCLCAFCWFHHVEKMWFSGSDDIIIAPDNDIITDEDSSASVTDTNAQTGNDMSRSDTDADTTDTVNEDIGTDIPDEEGSTSAEIETETPTEVDTPYWESLFAPKGTVEQTDTMYRSYNIYLTVDEVYREFDGYVAKYFVYDIYLRDISCLKAVYSESKHFINDYTSAGNSIAAISGDYWVNNAEISVKNGTLLRNDGVGENDFCVLYYDGVMKTYRSSELPAFKITDDVYQIWSFGPALLTDEGEPLDNFDDYSSYLAKEHPRSSIGYYEPGHYCFIVAEGRRHLKYNGERVYSGGIKLADLSKVYAELGCVAAFNLDGGDSAFGYYNGEIIRQDWDRANVDGKEPRKIFDIISISEID